MKEIRERDIEKYLVKRVKEAGGEIRKVKWIGRRGAPDRRVMLDGGHWVELKTPGGKLRPEQIREHQRMYKNGDSVWVLTQIEEVDFFMRTIMACETTF